MVSLYGLRVQFRKRVVHRLPGPLEQTPEMLISSVRFRLSMAGRRHTTTNLKWFLRDPIKVALLTLFSPVQTVAESR